MVHTAQLVYSNHQDLLSYSLYRMMSYWLDQTFAKMEGNHQNILKLLQFLSFIMPIRLVPVTWDYPANDLVHSNQS